ncbi:hypothetical protein OIT44_05940 [Weissella ceti]|uniref:Uncharacterized protein n=1 Tax=Weissella ceti TaxID=759620 RepID=A0ABT3E593_9LACO|nr:hypothetical protein [Weissella ceti]MCW0953598.1 hypothetical protein [Weissella ceti]QVK12831.1 hypothetical protein KHQ31_00515 [Weissella ceti]
MTTVDETLLFCVHLLFHVIILVNTKHDSKESDSSENRREKNRIADRVSEQEINIDGNLNFHNGIDGNYHGFHD